MLLTITYEGEYTAKTERTKLDDRFPEWGISPYIDLTISGTVRLSELL